MPQLILSMDPDVTLDAKSVIIISSTYGVYMICYRPLNIQHTPCSCLNAHANRCSGTLSTWA